MSDRDGGLQLTRARDLALVFAVALVAAYLLTRFNYSRLPVVPRLAGVSAAVLGIGEGIAGFNLRARIRQQLGRRPDATQGRGSRPTESLKPVPPLTAARALMVAKASSLAGAGLAGIWTGFLAYVAPQAAAVTAAGADSTTAVIGLVSALVLTAGALWLERCCVNPHDDTAPGGRA